MDGSQFDQLARAFGASHTRRGVVALTTVAGALSLLGLQGADGKKKKKKCKAPKVKCGKKCLPAGSCCTDADCGGNGVCQGGTCACFTGFRSCNGSCIPAGNCCGDADCGGGVCTSGQCQCLGGTKPCGRQCIPESACCTQADCPNPDACTTCQGGVCNRCASGQMCLANGSCGDICSQSGACNAANTCSCNVNGGDDVCRETITTTQCTSRPTCTTTATCPAGTVCSSVCNPSRCIALCDV